MYSGTTIRNHSGRLMGTHQKIDRIARVNLEKVLPGSNFPSIKEILHFEGNNGPDGIKRKSPAKDEPWHYYNPVDPKDTQILDIIREHQQGLVAALKSKEYEKAAFEAAWLAHAVVDGLTPAHHYPLEEKLKELRGEGLDTRTSFRKKNIILSPGDAWHQILAKNWEYWGAKGVMSSHALFEFGIATTTATHRFKTAHPTQEELDEVMQKGLIPVFESTAREIYEMNLYNRFIQKGWGRKLAQEIHRQLLPSIIRTVTLAWYEVIMKAKAK